MSRPAKKKREKKKHNKMLQAKAKRAKRLEKKRLQKMEEQQREISEKPYHITTRFAHCNVCYVQKQVIRDVNLAGQCVCTADRNPMNICRCVLCAISSACVVTELALVRTGNASVAALRVV